MAASAVSCGDSDDSSSKKSKKSDDSSVLQTEDSSKTETESKGDSKSEDSSKNDESVSEESTPVGSEPDTTTAPATQYPDDGDDEGVTYDPDAYHKPLPRVDVSGDNWTQRPSGWLDDIKGTTNYKYYNRNKWSEYKGENDPNFPNGDPAVEWAFMFVDVPNGFGTLVKSSDTTPYTYDMLAEILEYDVNAKKLQGDESVANRVEELWPANDSTGATFYSKEIESDSTNDLDKYLIKFEVSVCDDDGYTKHYYNGSFKARDIADSGSDKYSYSYSDSKIDMYWTVYPYTLMGKALINIRIVDKATNTTYDRILRQN